MLTFFFVNAVALVKTQVNKNNLYRYEPEASVCLELSASSPEKPRPLCNSDLFGSLNA